MIFSKKIKKSINKYIDHLIPKSSTYGMPSASEVINYDEFLEKITILKDFIIKVPHITKFKDFDSNDKIYQKFIKNADNLKFENSLFKILVKYYFTSEQVLDSLSKKNDLINQDYINLISSSEMIEKLIKKQF